jgi:hypothetical protein
MICREDLNRMFREETETLTQLKDRLDELRRCL